MANHGKVSRVLREAVAVLVEELGREDAAEMLRIAAAELRGVAAQPKRLTAAGTGRKRRRRAGDHPD